MKFAYVLRASSEPSETFIATEMAEHRAAGHDVHALAKYADPSVAPAHANDHLVHWPPAFPSADPPEPWRRRASAVLWRMSHWNLHGLGGLNFFRYGRPAGTLALIGHAQAAKACAPQEFDAIHAHFVWNGVAACFLRDIGVLRGPVGVVVHGSDMSQYLRMRGGSTALRHVMRKADLVLPVSEHWASVLERYGCPPEKLRVHHMGVNVEALQHAARTQTESSRSAPRSELRLASVGRLTAKKGFDTGIQALAQLKSKGTEVRYDIYGAGEQRSELEHLASSLGMKEQVHFQGWIAHDDVPRVLADSDALLVPSRTAEDGDKEGIPVVAMEALAIGVPVVATDHSGIPELVSDGVTGLLCREDDAEGMADAIDRLARDTEFRERMAAGGQEWVARGFDSTVQAAKLRERYKNVSQKHRA